MAYFLYNRTHVDGRWRFVWKDETHLFGCNASVIVNALKSQISESQQAPQPPWRWHVNVPEVLPHGDIFVIDLMPNQRQSNNDFTFYELMEVWAIHMRGTIRLLYYGCGAC